MTFPGTITRSGTNTHPPAVRSRRVVSRRSDYEYRNRRVMESTETSNDVQLPRNDDKRETCADSLTEYHGTLEEPESSKKFQRKNRKAKRLIEYIRRSARIIHDKKNENSSNGHCDSDNNSNETKKTRRGSLHIKCSKLKNDNKEKYKNDYNFSDSDILNDDNMDPMTIPKPKKHTNNKPISVTQLPVSQITQEMLNNVNYSMTKKVISSEGTTCHQCRQKTLDQKSYCRHNGCKGIQGMFCGFCLKNRYGEDVQEVLLDEYWTCPPCRRYCNCSICRRKFKKTPTGQLAPLARAKGFQSVRHMLRKPQFFNTT